MAMKTKGRFGSISKDFFYNILASVILTGVMQVVVYPFLALKFNNQEYGTLLTIMGIANTVIVAFGNTLNNVRLIVNNDYEREHLEGDFNGLLFLFLSYLSSMDDILNKHQLSYHLLLNLL